MLVFAVSRKNEKIFMIGTLGVHDNFALPIIEAKLANKPMTIRDYFEDELDFDYYYRHPRNYNRRGVFSVDEPSPTIRGVNRPIPKGYPGHSLDMVKDLSTIRPLTSQERARIQTFPKHFIFEGSKTEIEQQIGNAVPVNLAKFIASTIKEIIENGVPKQTAPATLFDMDKMPMLV